MWLAASLESIVETPYLARRCLTATWTHTEISNCTSRSTKVKDGKVYETDAYGRVKQQKLIIKDGQRRSK